MVRVEWLGKNMSDFFSSQNSPNPFLSNTNLVTSLSIFRKTFNKDLMVNTKTLKKLSFVNKYDITTI